MWKAENFKIRLLGPFWPKSGLFRPKEDQFTRIFSKRSAIRPMADKADLLGSTALQNKIFFNLSLFPAQTVAARQGPLPGQVAQCTLRSVTHNPGLLWESLVPSSLYLQVLAFALQLQSLHVNSS